MKKLSELSNEDLLIIFLDLHYKAAIGDTQNGLEQKLKTVGEEINRRREQLGEIDFNS